MRPLSSTAEFITLVSLLTALTAISLDAMLPALDDMGASFGISEPARTQLIVTLFVVGMVVGDLVSGPLSDAWGRRPVILGGLVIYLAGCLLAIFAQSFEWLLVSRVVQGLGASAPRIAARALVRDCYEGEAMARIMSFIMVIFIIVPMIAPAMGQAALAIADWRLIFGVFLTLAVIAFFWFGLRQPETLAVEKRVALSLVRFFKNSMSVAGNWQMLSHTLAVGFVFGALLTYLATAQALFDDLYDAGNLFALYFAFLAFWIGLASFVNGNLVMRFGMVPLVRIAYFLLAGFGLCHILVALLTDGTPSLWIFLSLTAGCFFSIGLLFGNLTALALQPVGHLAGLASSLNGAISSLTAVAVALVFGPFYNATTYPLVFSFLLAAVAGFGLTATSRRPS